MICATSPSPITPTFTCFTGPHLTVPTVPHRCVRSRCRPEAHPVPTGPATAFQVYAGAAGIVIIPEIRMMATIRWQDSAPLTAVTCDNRERPRQTASTEPDHARIFPAALSPSSSRTSRAAPRSGSETGPAMLASRRAASGAPPRGDRGASRGALQDGRRWHAVGLFRRSGCHRRCARRAARDSVDEPWPDFPGPPPCSHGAAHRRGATADDDDYLAAPLNRLARLLGMAQGSQILLTEAVEQLTQDDLPIWRQLSAIWARSACVIWSAPSACLLWSHPDLLDSSALAQVRDGSSSPLPDITDAISWTRRPRSQQ